MRIENRSFPDVSSSWLRRSRNLASWRVTNPRKRAALMQAGQAAIVTDEAVGAAASDCASLSQGGIP
jgi:hypothetical protein